MLRSPLLLDLIVVAAGIGNEIVFKKDCLIPFFEVKTSLSAVPAIASTLEQCQSKCQAESKCKAFTFIPSASQCKLSDSTDLRATLAPAGLVSWAGDCDCSAISDSSIGLQCWAKKEGAYLKQCTVKALRSTATSGWKGNCEGLEVQPLEPGQDCETACVENPLCSTWQSVPANTTNAKPNCYTGAGFNCDADRQGHDMPAPSARLQHGEIKVIESLTTQQIIGLELHSNLDVDACREICYSDLFCQHWQFFDQARTDNKKGCWVESKKKRANYPAQAVNISDAESISAGEFIQHWCGTDTTTTTTTTTTTLFQLTQVENGNLKVGDRVFIPAKTLVCLLNCPTTTTEAPVVTQMVVVTDTPLVVTEMVSVTHTVPVTEMVSVTDEPLVVTEMVSVTHTVPVTKMVSVTDAPLVVTEMVPVTLTVPVTEMVSVTDVPLVLTEMVSVTQTVPVTEMVSVTDEPLVVTEMVSVTHTVPVSHLEAEVVTAAPSATSAAAIARRLAEDDDAVKFESSVRELKCPLAGAEHNIDDGTWGQITAVDEQHGVFSIKLESSDSQCIGAKPEDLSLSEVSGGQVSGGQVSGGQVSGGQVSGGQVSGGQVSGGQVSDGKISGGRSQTPTPPPDHTWPMILIGLLVLCCAIVVCFLYSCQKNEDPPAPKKKKNRGLQDPEPVAAVPVQTVPHHLLPAPAVQYQATPSMMVHPMVSHPTSVTYASAPVAYASAPVAGSYQFAGAQPTTASYPAGSPAAYA